MLADVMELDRRVCDRARRARDARFDGRFFIAVTSTGVYCRPICPARSPKDANVRYFPTAAAAEAWSLEQLTIPVSELGKFGRELPFWIRLGYRVLDAEPSSAENGSGDFSLRGLVEALSRRRRDDSQTHSMEAGPFRLPR